MKDKSDSFNKLYDQNYSRIRQLLLRIAGPQEADDLAQIVFAKAAQALATFRGEAQVSTWLYRIAARVASDWLRSRAAKEAKVTVELHDAANSETHDASASSVSLESHASFEQDLIRKEMGDCIRGVIGELPDKQRTVLMLAELGGLSHNEVAETLGINRASAKVRLHRARAALKQMLEMRCDFSRDGDNEFVCEPKSAAPCPSQMAREVPA